MLGVPTLACSADRYCLPHTNKLQDLCRALQDWQAGKYAALQAQALNKRHYHSMLQLLQATHIFMPLSCCAFLCCLLLCSLQSTCSRMQNSAATQTSMRGAVTL